MIVSKLLLHLSKVDVLIYRLIRLSNSNTLVKDQVKMIKSENHLNMSVVVKRATKKLKQVSTLLSEVK